MTLINDDSGGRRAQVERPGKLNVFCRTVSLVYFVNEFPTDFYGII